jgi:hypothetical protein
MRPYVLLRALHLAITAAVMPLGVWSFVHLGEVPSGGVRLAVFAVGAVLALFVIIMDQADYPVTTLGALGRSSPLLANAALGFWSGGGQVFSAAHWTLTSLLASLACSLTIAGGLALASDDPDLKKNRGLVFALLIPLALAAAAVTLVMAWPLRTGFVPGAAVILASLAWLAQTVSTTRAWLRQSVFSSYAQTAEGHARAEAMRPWNGPAAIALVAVLAALAVVLLW